MQIFDHRANNLVYMFNESVRKELASLIKNEEEQIKPSPTVMEPNQIKQKLNNLKTDKNKLKSFILNFDNLNDCDKLKTFLEYFYSKNTYLLEDSQIKIFEETNPIKKTIKTNFIIEEKDVPYISFEHINPKEFVSLDADVIRYNTYFDVYVKNGVKLNKFKTYSPVEISKMIENGDIIVAKTRPRKQVSIKNGSNCVICPEFKTIHDGFYLDVLTEDMINEMKTKNPEIFEEMMNDINLDEIKAYYELEYLPLYKKCLNYLAECAKVSVAKEQADRKTFNAQINKSYKTEQKIKKLSEEITNTSKGR